MDALTAFKNETFFEIILLTVLLLITLFWAVIVWWHARMMDRDLKKLFDRLYNQERMK